MPPTLKRRATATSLRSKRQRVGVYEVRPRNPHLLARGMSSRYLSKTSPLGILNADEIDRDMRHMEAYANACKAYSQQLYLYTNAGTPQATPRHHAHTKRHTAVLPKAPTLPVRIDPEEEKRLGLLRKRIVAAEAERELLETEYVSLRASYVHEVKRLKQTRLFVDGHLDLLQKLIAKRGTVLALQRVRVAMARDVKLSLEYRNKCAALPKGSGSLFHRDDRADATTDVLDVWNQVEAQWVEAERECRQVETEWTKKTKGNVVPWEALTMPRTPRGVPLLLSQVSRAPDKGAAYGCNGMFGGNPHSMVWLRPNMPKTLDGKTAEAQNVAKIKEDEGFLRSELDKEKIANEELQRDICQRRKRNDELSAMMSLLRSETEALVHRHNVLLDTPEARAVSQDLHKKAVEEREKMEKENVPVEEGGRDEDGDRLPSADLENDGDDEGGDEEEDEAGDETMNA